jgi:cell wall-associated NlpC family hydrolase
MDMLGQPYRRGGTGPGGFDCSGLVAYAGRQVGLKFPRTAREQQRGGVPVARAALEPGDLVFMRLRGRQHHVGIMIDGVHFVHAPSSGGRVRVDSLDSKPYASRILAVRRPDFPR